MLQEEDTSLRKEEARGGPAEGGRRRRGLPGQRGHEVKGARASRALQEVDLGEG